MLSVQLPEGIDIGDEFIASGESTNHLDLQVLLRAADADTILLRESLEQMDSLVDHTVPGVSFGVFEGGLAEAGPFFEKHRGGILAAEIGLECLFKAAAKDHCSPRLFFSPSVQIAETIASWATKVLVDLRVAIDHGGFPDPFHPWCFGLIPLSTPP